MLKKINISTKKDDVFEITDEVKKAVEESGVKEGTCVVYTPHTTAAIVVTSRMDPDGFDDLRDEVNRLILNISLIRLLMRQAISNVHFLELP